MKYPLRTRTELFDDYFYDADENMIFYSYKRSIPSDPLTVRVVNGIRVQQYESDPNIVPVIPTRSSSGDLVVCIRGRYIRIDYLIAYTVHGVRSDSYGLIHLDNDLDNYNYLNLKWKTPGCCLQDCLQKYGVSTVLDIPEVWKTYIAPRNKNIVYTISNHGHMKKNGEFVPLNTDTGGYLRTTYQDEKTHETVNLFLHRAVAESFVSNPNPDRYTIVNHVDGVKYNCYEWNLEWTDLSENCNHAIATNLSKGKVNSPEVIEEICKDLAAGVPVKKICESYKVNGKFVSAIYTGRRWSSISKKYDFPARSFTQEQKDIVNKMIDDGIKPREAAYELGVPYDTKFCSMYERIQRHKKYQSSV